MAVLSLILGGLLLLAWLFYGQIDSSQHLSDMQPSRTPQWTRSLSNKVGVHMLLTDGAHDWPLDIWPQHLRYARQAVGEWGYVLALVRLDDLDIVRWQFFMDQCTELQLTPILRLATTHQPSGGWHAPPRDDDDTYRATASRYANFIQALEWPPVRQTGGHYVIVGNEPNRGGEWGGRPDPAAYARFLTDVADALHASDPHAQVLNAGFDLYAPHTGGLPILDNEYFIDAETFMDEMVAAQPDVFKHLDAWASHAYPLGPFVEAPWVQTYQFDRINGAENLTYAKPPPNIHNRGINGYRWSLFKLAQYGVESLPVLITETGWRHAESVDASSPDNGRPLPSAQTVAQYMDLALQGNNGRYPEFPSDGWTPWLSDNRVKAVVFFAFDGNPAYWGHTNWLELNDQGQVMGEYYANEQN